MALRKAARRQVKLKIALSGAPGSGKSLSALRLAYGLCGDWNRIGVIDSENNSAELYVGWKPRDNPKFSVGEFTVNPIAPPYHPVRTYVRAIHEFDPAQFDVLIIDSASHEWDGEGGCLEIHGDMQGSSFSNWRKVGLLHKQFVDAVLQIPMHVISTTRSKTDWAMSENDRGKTEPKKVGLKEIQRDGWEYEHTLMFRLYQNHLAEASKDRTSLFVDRGPFLITEEVGKELREWAELGKAPTEEELYEATLDQRRIIAGMAEGLGVDVKRERDWLQRLSKASLGTPMSRMRNVILDSIDHAREAAP